MSAPQSLSDVGGGAVNNDGRIVDGSGTAAGEARPHDELYRQSAVHFLNTYDGDKLFCLIVALVNPHDVQEYPGRGVRGARGLSIHTTFSQGGYRLEDFEDLPIDLPPSLDDDLSTKPSVHAAFRRLLAVGTGHTRTHERQLRYARFYAYLNQQVDRQILKLLDALDANGLTDDTLIIRTSDHGELGLAHGRMRQKFYNAYRETLSIPLIVSNPRLYPQPRSTDSFAGLIDVLPTLATVTGAPESQRYGFRGHDLTPILSDPKASVQDFLHFTYEDDVFPVKGAAFLRAIVEEGWKYAVYYDPFTGPEAEAGTRRRPEPSNAPPSSRRRTNVGRVGWPPPRAQHGTPAGRTTQPPSYGPQNRRPMPTPTPNCATCRGKSSSVAAPRSKG